MRTNTNALAAGTVLKRRLSFHAYADTHIFAVPIYSFNKQPDYRTLFIHGKHAGLGKNFFHVEQLFRNYFCGIRLSEAVCFSFKPAFFTFKFFYLAVDLSYARVYLLYKCGTEVSVRQGAYQVIRLVGKFFYCRFNRLRRIFILRASDIPHELFKKYQYARTFL